MSNGAATGAAGAAAAAAIANAIKASGAIVRLDPDDFKKILERATAPLVVIADAFFGGKKYLTSYKGLIFYTKVPEPIELPSEVEVIVARKIWIPS